MPRQACPCQAYLGDLFIIANSVDPEQMSHVAASDLGLHCLSMSLLIRHKAFTHGDVPYRIVVVENRILFVISDSICAKQMHVGRGKYLENHL